MKRVALAALLFLGGLKPAAPQQPIPWAWERRDDLREYQTVAYYAGLITLANARIDVAPRRNALLLAKNTHRIAVIRIETKNATLDEAQRAETLNAIKRLYRNAEELQIDFDAMRSERAFYRALLFDVRKAIDARLTITALASWCMDDRWMSDLPIDDAVPMLFQMGRDAKAIRARLARGEDFAEPICRASVGVSLDEPILTPKGRRVWLWKNAGSFASR